MSSWNILHVNQVISKQINIGMRSLSDICNPIFSAGLRKWETVIKT